MLSYESTGKNIEQAINNALFELKAIRDDVDIKILEEGGFFKKAKVLVTISKDAEHKYKKKNTINKDCCREDLNKTENNSTQACCCEEEGVDKESYKCNDKQCDCNQNCTCEENCTCNEENKCSDDCLCNQEEKDIKTKQVKQQKENGSDAEKAKKFIEELLQKGKLLGQVSVTETKDEVFVTITGAGDLIGYRGDGLNALQYLTSVYVSKNNRNAKKVRVDCDNYRKKREETLIALAKRMEKKVEKTNASVKLEPMTANERRIIHAALSESETVCTISKGDEPHRYLIIKPKVD